MRRSFFTLRIKRASSKKHGANVEIRPFDTGTAAARAVIAGDIEMAMSPSALVINQDSNTGVGLVAIYGLINSDMVLASVDPTKTSCRDVVGQPVGVDTVGGAHVKPKHGSPDVARDIAFQKIKARVDGTRMASEKLGLAMAA